MREGEREREQCVSLFSPSSFSSSVSEEREQGGVEGWGGVVFKVGRQSGLPGVPIL